MGSRVAAVASITGKIARFLPSKGAAYLGFLETGRKASSISLIGLASSGVFLIANGLWISVASDKLPMMVPLLLFTAGTLIVALSASRRLPLPWVNVLALVTHLAALFTLYLLATRFLIVTYSTDTIVGTYAGLLGVLRFQNPYLYSIRPFLDQFGFSPSFYTPRVDGSFEFHLNYPAFSFLALAPLYLAGLHDVRDAVLFFHVLTILVVFGLASPRLKSISLVPLAFGFPLAVAFSWTDSVWAFLLLLSAAAWNRDKRLSLGLVGLAGATKQIALVAAPFILLRLWHQTSGSRPRRSLAGLASLLVGFAAPNLPFILSSPSAWWAGTVEAYLPSKSPQITGGVGLPQILTDLGVSLPSFFSVGLMAATMVGALYLYSKHFGRYRRFAWMMPVLVLFFYHRSFPNYLIYWAIPLLGELVTSKPSAPPNQPSHLGYAQSRMKLRWPTGNIRRRVATSALLVILLAGVLVGVSGAYISRFMEPKAEISVNDTQDPDNIGAVTRIEVTLTNRGGEPLSPRFFVKWYFPQAPWRSAFLWNSTDANILQPNTSESYNLTATDALAAVPRGAPFRVLVFDSLTGELASQSETLQADLPSLTIANPKFKWWALDSEVGRAVPFGWKLSGSGPAKSSGELLPVSGGGFQFKVNNSLTLPTPSRVTLSQTIPPASVLRVLVFQPANAEPQGRIVFGTKITDAEHLVYFLFSQTANQVNVRQFQENTTITVPLAPETWTWVTLDLSAVWSGQSWSAPESVEFSLYLETTATGVHSAFVREIEA